LVFGSLLLTPLQHHPPPHSTKKKSVKRITYLGIAASPAPPPPFPLKKKKKNKVSRDITYLGIAASPTLTTTTTTLQIRMSRERTYLGIAASHSGHLIAQGVGQLCGQGEITVLVSHHGLTQL
jgi:hypothetical protein